MPQETPRAFSCRRLIPLALLLLGGALFIAVGGRRYLSFEALAAKHDWACALVSARPVVTAICFIGTYAGLAALSVPGAALLTMSAACCSGRGSAPDTRSLARRSARRSCSSRPERDLRAFRPRRAAAAPSRGRLSRMRSTICWCCGWCRSFRSGWSIWSPAWSGCGCRPTSLATFFGIMPGTFVYASLGNGLGSVIAEEPDRISMFFRPRILLPIIGLAAAGAGAGVLQALARQRESRMTAAPLDPRSVRHRRRRRRARGRRGRGADGRARRADRARRDGRRLPQFRLRAVEIADRRRPRSRDVWRRGAGARRRIRAAARSISPRSADSVAQVIAAHRAERFGRAVRAARRHGAARPRRALPARARSAAGDTEIRAAPLRHRDRLAAGGAADPRARPSALFHQRDDFRQPRAARRT